MTETQFGAEFVVTALERYGVTHVFGNPGTTELPFIKALDESDVEYRLALHEDIAVGMAAGYAVTRRYQHQANTDHLPLGVVNLHVAPGLAHGLSNLNEAMHAGAPLVVTAGEQATDFQHEEPILLADLVSMADPFTKWSAEVKSVTALPTMLRRAVRIALTPPAGPVFLALPLDVMLDETDAAVERLGTIPDAGCGTSDAVEQAADLLADADEPVLVIGDGVARAGPDAVEAAIALAEASGARVHGELLAAEVGFPTDHDQWVSFLPPIESIAANALDTDTIALIGCSTMTTPTRHETSIVSPDATILGVGTDAWELGKTEPVDCAIVGDPGRITAAIADRVTERLSDDEQATRRRKVREIREATREKLAGVGTGDPDDPRASKAELVDALRAAAPGARVVDESVTAQLVFMNRGTLAWGDFISGKGGGLGYGLPAAVGAAMAETERDVVAFVGDGAYLYYPHALYSAARYDIDLTVVVADNRNYRILKDNTLAMFGGDEDDYQFTGMDFEPPVNIPKNAESHGARGMVVDDPDTLEATIRQAVAASDPVVVDVPVQD